MFGFNSFSVKNNPMTKDIINIFKKLPPTLKKPSKIMNYGTAGYRDNSDDLLNCLCRASLIAYIRSATFCGKTIGIMITASHNKKTDNGIKIIDHNGDYIDSALEKYCDEIVNSNDKDLFKTLSKIHRAVGNTREFGNGAQASIAIGRDTRESGELFSKEIINILELLKSRVIDYELVTTPQLHWLVRHTNIQGSPMDKETYYEHLMKHYHLIILDRKKEELPVYVDTANGVGTFLIQQLNEGMVNKEIKIINQSANKEIGNYVLNDDLLNEDCGADYVITNNCPPKNIITQEELIMRCACLDGDADRLIYFRSKGDFQIINGDRLAVFILSYIDEILNKINYKPSMGAVMSHYSNTAAIKALEVFGKVEIANTGVKNFIALSRTFDVGVYSEPNGHFSVTFSEKFCEQIDKFKELTVQGSKDERFMRILHSLKELFDPSVGDAIANFVALEAIIERDFFDRTIKSYDPLPTRLMTINVENKNNLITKDDITIIKPPRLRDSLDVLQKKYNGRVFVRPSGTESVVRVFAEAEKQKDCDLLAVNAAQMVYDICVGIGHCPEISYQ